MSKKLFYLIPFVLVLSLAGNTSGGLVAHWKLDEGSGKKVFDSSGGDHQGTVNGDPRWVAGYDGGALEFDGDDYVDIPSGVNELGAADFTIAAWIKTTEIGMAILSKSNGDSSWTSMEKQLYIADSATSEGVNDGTVEYVGWGCEWIRGSIRVDDGQWHHVAVTWDIGAGIGHAYVDGVEGTYEVNYNGGADNAGDTIRIGFSPGEHSANFIGLIDDVRIYDHVLSGVEVLSAMQGQIWPYAWGPEPADGALHTDTWVNISWKPGGHAVSHDVYLGDNFDDVNDGAESKFRGNQAETFFVAGFLGFPYPDGLVPGTTYYWRIDEVNDTEPNSPWKGDVWSFSIPPKTAYYPDPADSAELVNLTANLSWTAGFGAKLHTVFFGDNFDDVSNATEGLPQGTTTYSPGPLKTGKTYYWRVDEFDIIETFKGDVWSFTTQGAVVSLKPSNGAVDVKQTQILSWSPGVHAASHEVYFGTGKEVVRDADTSSPEYKGTRDLGSESYDPGKLEWDSTYYWRIDEVNNTNADSPWIGPVWSFTTANFLIVDDFESYNDLDPADPDSNRIFNAWLDGYDDPTNGSLVGYDSPPFAEQTIVHSGIQSIPLFYDNSVGYSEATLTLTYPRDWTEKGVNTLTIWFRGDSANAAETFYVALNGSAVVYHDNPNAAQIETWTEWNIDLQAFADQGVNLANVNTIALGLGNKKNPAAGGSGTMYFDDIRLYPPPPTE